MDRLDQALRRYQQILPKAADHAGVPLKRAEVWLKEEVASALEEIAGRPTFREYAAWPVAALGRHSDTRERRLVDNLDQALTTCARALSRLVQKKDLLRRLRTAFPAVEYVSGGMMRVEGQGVHGMTQERSTLNELSLQLSQLRQLAEDQQDDLVNVNDYFNPQQAWIRTADNEYLQRGGLIRSANPELMPIGNFVVRCLWKRVCQRRDTVQVVRKNCEVVLRDMGSRYREERDALDSAWSTMTDLVGSLESSLLAGPESKLHDACVVATQVLTAWHVAPDVRWLGLDPETVEHGRQTIRAQLTQLDNAHLLDRIAVSLGELRFLSHDPGSQSSEFERAVANGGLVMVENDREVYWETSRLPRLPARAWGFLHALARKAALHADAGPCDVSDVDGGLSDTAMSTGWSRLRQRLPPSLSRLVKPGIQRASYRLQLDPSRIRIFGDRT